MSNTFEPASRNAAIRNIIVTGASRGIGYETVKSFSQFAQNHIIAISRDTLGLERLVDDCKKTNPETTIYPLPFDLENDDYNTQLLPSILKHFQQVDILINNAGKLINKPLESFSVSDFDSIFNVNVKSVFRLIQVLIPYMSENSHIVNISSMGGYQGSSKFPGLALYSAAKGAVAIFSECLAEELKNRNIKVNCLAPGSVRTKMFSEAFPEYKAQLSAKEMADFIRYFAINGHNYFNGKILPVSVSTP